MKKTYVYPFRSAKYNKTIYFDLPVNLREEIGLPPTSLNALFSMQIVFVTFIRKSPEPNFRWQRTHDIFV